MPKRPLSAPNTTRIVEMLVFPLVQILDVTGPLQVFSSANDFVLESGGHPPYDLKVVAQSGAKVMASAAGLKLSTLPLPLASDPVDTLMVAGGQGVDAAAADLAIIDWVQSRALKARRNSVVADHGDLGGFSVLHHGSEGAERFAQ